MSINQFLKQLGQGDSIRDFNHAARLFVGDNFRLAPKQGFLYHVFIDLDPSIKRTANDQQIEAGMLVKSADLPKFTVDTKTLNSYNRPNIIQTKIKYDPITISFHDDHADVVRNFWFDYYHYYYRDADLGYADKSGQINPTYYQATKYGPRDKNTWGYTPRSYSVYGDSTTQQFIRSIRIYSMHQKRFSEYTLINPMITSFRHGQHTAGSSEVMGHEMTVSFENVLYAAGWVKSTTVQGFADIHYDKTPSPLTPKGGGTDSIIGPGGLLDLADDVIVDLANGNFAGAIFSAFRGYQNFKNVDLANVAKGELEQFGRDILRGNNPTNRVYVPNVGNLSTGAPVAELGQNLGAGFPAQPAGVATSNGEQIGARSSQASLGTALAAIGRPIAASGGSSTLLAVGGLIAGAGALNRLIKINPVTGAADAVETLPSAAPPAPTNVNDSFVNSQTQAIIDSRDADAAATRDSLASVTRTPPINGLV